MAALVSKDSGVRINRHGPWCLYEPDSGWELHNQVIQEVSREWVSVIGEIFAASSRTRCLVILNHCKTLDSSMTRSLIDCTPLLRMGRYSSLSQIEMAS